MPHPSTQAVSSMTIKLAIKKLEVDLTDHCNLRCNGCDHASNILPPKFHDVERILGDLTRVAQFVRFDELLVAGGEPLLHPGLIDLLEGIRRLDPSFHIVLITNGLLLHRAPERLWELIDGLWISVYPGVKRQENVSSSLAELAAKHNVWVWQKETATFVQTLLDRENTHKEWVDFIYKSCMRAHVLDCHLVREGRYYKCTPSAFMAERLQLRGCSVENQKEDGVAIHDNPHLGEDLARLLQSHTPLKACTWCLGSIGRQMEHRQMTRDEAETCREPFGEPPGEVIDAVHPLLRDDIQKALQKPRKFINAGAFLVRCYALVRGSKGFRQWEALRILNKGKVFQVPTFRLETSSAPDSAAERRALAAKGVMSDEMILSALRFALRHGAFLLKLSEMFPGMLAPRAKKRRGRRRGFFRWIKR